MTANILIIDDAYEDIQSLRRILSTVGYTVRATRDGISGLRAAQHTVPDLVLLDIMLPDQDGFEVCRQFLTAEQFAGVPVIFVSALQDVSLKAQAFDVGAYDYITKPYNSKEVLIRVQHQLEHKLLRAQLQESARLQERQRIARDLHDSLSQSLFIVGASVQSILLDAPRLPDNVQTELHNVNDLVKGVSAEMRTLLNELRPAQISKTPLHILLGQLVDAFRTRIHAQITTTFSPHEPPSDVKLAFYRIAQEALNNVAKHAQAQHLDVAFGVQGQHLQLLVADDGCGFDVTQVGRGIGLNSMRERAEQQGMSLEIISAPGEGTRLVAIWQQL